MDNSDENIDESSPPLKKKHGDAVKGFECDICRVLLASKEFLERHRKKHRHEGHDREHACPFCCYSTSICENLEHHLLTHTKERPHPCSLCDKAFTQAAHLQRHLRTHTGEKPFTCKECGKGFNQSSNLRMHERIHAGERPWICATCGKGFTYKNDLDRHYLIHTGQKPYKCPQCDYRARHQFNLKQHVAALHAKEYSHMCGKCGKGFVLASRLKRHMDDVHRGK